MTTKKVHSRIAGVEGFRNLKLDETTTTAEILDCWKALIRRAEFGDRAAIALLVVSAGTVQQVLESSQALEILAVIDAVAGRKQEPKA